MNILSDNSGMDKNTVCSRCGENKPEAFFHSYKSKCKPCLAAIQRDYRKSRHSGYWVEKDKQYALKKRYGLSLAEYEAKCAEQHGKCAICGVDPRTRKDWSPNHQNLHVDHDHKTGKVRGLLCNFCNRAIGFLKDDQNIAARAIGYLQKHFYSS